MEKITVRFNRYEKSIRLKFGHDGGNFWLYNPEPGTMHYKPEMNLAGSLVLLDDRGRIAVYYAACVTKGGARSVAFWLDGVKRFYRIQGVYDVPMLGVKMAPFDKVLEAVKKYFEEWERKNES